MWKWNWQSVKASLLGSVPGIVLVSVLILSTILLMSCSAATGGDACGPWRALRPTVADVLSEGFARQVLTHNLTGEELRCWEAPNAR